MEETQIEGQTTVEEQVAAAEQKAAEQADSDKPFEISDEQAEEIAGPGVEINLPMQTLMLNGSNLRVAHDEETGERALIVGPIALNLILPFTAESAKAVGADLAGVSGLVLAKPGDVAGEAKKLQVVGG